MTTLALIFFGYIVAQALVILAACALVARKPNPFKARKADHDKARNLASRTLKRIHP